MKKHIIIPAFAAIFLFAACKKTYDSFTNQPQTETQATPTPIGTTIGNTITKDIGPSGGSIISDDGKLEVIVPTGAVANYTKFSIQPITNFCPGGLNAFRLSPDGMTFTSPVTLKFNYTDDDAGGSFASFFEIAFQDKDNIWYSLPSAEIDSINKTISVQVTHFTDWANVAGLKIDSHGINSLKVNEGAELTIQGNPQKGDEDQLYDLTDHIPVRENLPFNAKWYVNDVLNGNVDVGEISISPGSDGKIVQYKAPARVPSPSTVTISAELTDFGGTWYAYYHKKKYTFNKVILTKKIKILPDEKNYSFHYEQILDYACSYAGTFETDSVEMEIHVKDGKVTATNIVNHASYITNPTVQIGGSCTMTTEAGTKGPINITSVGGAVQPGVDDTDQFTLALTNSGATSTGCTYTCPNVSTPTNPIVLKDNTISFDFLLSDDVQAQGVKGQGVYWILTPKPK